MRLISKKHLAVLGAASTDETRYMLNGIHFEETEKGLKAVATDGHIMAIVESKQSDHDGFPVIPAITAAENTATNATVPTEAIKKLLKLIPKKHRTLPILENAVVKFSDSVTAFGTTDLESPNVISARNIEGYFPNYEQVIPKHSRFQMLVNPLKLASMLEMASKVVREGESVLLHFNGQKNPIKVTGDDNNGISFIGVVMPMQDKALTLVDGYEELEEKLKLRERQIRGYKLAIAAKKNKLVKKVKKFVR